MDEIFEFSDKQAAELSKSRLWNADIAPTKKVDRKWGTWDIAALWIGMSVCIPNLYASVIAYFARHELVAGNTHDFSRQCNCACSDGA